MGSQRRRSRRKRSFLPRFSTIALLLVLAGAGYFFYEMKLVKEDRADQEHTEYEGDIVKNKLVPLVNSINEALANNDSTAQAGAAEMKKKLDDVYISNLDTFLLRNNRYEHFRTTLEEELVLPRTNQQGDSVKVSDADAMIQLLIEYEKVEDHAVVQ